MGHIVKSFIVATTACAVALLALVSTSESSAPGHQTSVVESSAALADSSARRVEVGDVVRVDGRVPKRLVRGTATLLRVGGGRVATTRIDERRRYALEAAAPREAGQYAYEVSVRVKGRATTVKRLRITVVDPSTTPTPTPVPVQTGPKGDPNDWTYLGGTRVARWDPCQTITWSVTGTSPYAASQSDLETAFARISAATGLAFVQVADPEVSTFDITWTNAAAEPRLAGSVVGLGGFMSYPQPSGPSEVVSGYVLLDNEHTIPAGFATLGASWGKVMLHEMSHAVGLGHAAGVDQLMYPSVAPNHAEFGAGDLTGLTAVGAAQGCFTEPTHGRKGAPALTDVFWE